ncbi:hypothetical protein Bca4012_078609 [Brassica carinata]
MAEHDPVAQEEFARQSVIKRLSSKLSVYSSDIGGSGSVKTSKERRDNENPKVKHELRVNCAEALWMLARGNVANSRRITETKGLLSLAKIVEKEIGELQYNCLMTLMEITASAESQTLTLDEQLSRRIHLLLNAGSHSQMLSYVGP